MSVRVRLFASLRAAAGTAEVVSEAPTLRALLDELSDRYGEPFASRLQRAQILVDDERAAAAGDRDLGDAEEVALLPPFAGG